MGLLLCTDPYRGLEPAPPVRAVRRAALSDAMLRRKAGARRIIRDVYTGVFLVALFHCSVNIIGGLLIGLPLANETSTVA